MDANLEVLANIPDANVARIIHKMVFNDVLRQLKRNVEPWHPFNEERCGCRTFLLYPAYIDNYTMWGDEYEKYTGAWWGGNDDDYHHGPFCCEQPNCPTCQMCSMCYANWQYYDNKD